ncbi:MAG: helix-hairpin-helix domain-containing protein [Cytophagaceae bacterium]
MSQKISNQEIIEAFRLTGLLMELHDENPFKLRGIQNAVFNLEKINSELSGLSIEALENLEGIGKSLAGKIYEMCCSGKFSDLESLVEKTPKGVIEMLGIKGIGPKKVRTLWKDLNITDIESLLTACNEDKVAALKGFGTKTQENIKQSLLFRNQHKDFFLYAEAEPFALNIEKVIREAGFKISLSGKVRRYEEVVDSLEYIAGTEKKDSLFLFLSQLDFLEQDKVKSGPFAWRGKDLSSGLKIEIRIFPEKRFGSALYIHSAAPKHLSFKLKDGKSLLKYLSDHDFASEKEIYEQLGWQYIPAELREGYDEILLAQENNMPNLIRYEDLKGVLHNHCTYSDGEHSLQQMALYCKSLGFQYLGISDHSKTAFYAGGLSEQKIEDQHREIDMLNKELAPFKILKGIESDILNDGSLDYDDSVLATFDFIVASIHSNLKMTKEKATERLIKAIENPFTTILGHSTGRLLLKREGYPIDHKKVIEACAANNVIIEINANPRRLDMEWKWVRYALEKGVMISINPDAHEMHGYHDMHYGVLVGRKAGLTPEMTFNALSLEQVEKHFFSKKSRLVKHA